VNELDRIKIVGYLIFELLLEGSGLEDVVVKIVGVLKDCFFTHTK
jgi:hypothetical protein